MIAMSHSARRDGVDISVVITAHREGPLVFRTLKSVYAAIEMAEQDGIACEIIVTLDRADDATRGYLNRFSGERHRCLEIDAGDLGTARNSGSAAAAGRYVAFLDADDLFCRNWLRDAYRTAEANPGERLLLHAEKQLFFEGENFSVDYQSSDSLGFATSNLVAGNYWSSILFLRRDDLQYQKFAAIEKGSGFGYEDWHFISEFLGAGGHLRIVKETCNFVRRKRRHSMLAMYLRAGAVLPPNSLLDPMRVAASSRDKVAGFVAAPPYAPKIILPDAPERIPSSFWDNGRKELTRFWRKLQKKARKLGAKLQRAVQKYQQADQINQEASPLVPRPLVNWFRRACADIHLIEPEIFPSSDVCQHRTPYPLGAPATGQAYEWICSHLTTKPTHVLLTPWLKPGGSDLELLNYATAIVNASTDHHILVIATEDTESPWAARLPPGVDFLPLGCCLRGAPEEERLHLLSTLLVQAGPRVIHNLNSALGFQTFTAIGGALRQQSSLFCCAYCEEVMPDGRIAGYAFNEVPACFEHLDGVFSDNCRIFEVLRNYFGFPTDRLFVHYQPMKSEHVAGPRRGTTLEVLWAGRLDRQKRPDILAKIAGRLAGEAVRFHVYGSALLGGDEAVAELLTLPNVQMHGAFSSFGALPHADFDLFLHTAQWEGLPNVLLEAMARGLPVMAADVGGVGELVKNDVTGVLISPFDDVEGYCQGLLKLASRREELARLAKAGTGLVRQRHSWSAFLQTLSAVPGYLTAGPACQTSPLLADGRRAA